MPKLKKVTLNAWIEECGSKCLNRENGSECLWKKVVALNTYENDGSEDDEGGSEHLKLNKVALNT